MNNRKTKADGEKGEEPRRNSKRFQTEPVPSHVGSDCEVEGAPFGPLENSQKEGLIWADGVDSQAKQ